ncbi:hypothetical protein CBM2606_A160080 [Cupriavidus taiwanensis]|nr:hypothetical protein CBM2606_A160080 [Cupriavidus taiwanensis]
MFFPPTSTKVLSQIVSCTELPKKAARRRRVVTPYFRHMVFNCL